MPDAIFDAVNSAAPRRDDELVFEPTPPAPLRPPRPSGLGGRSARPDSVGSTVDARRDHAPWRDFIKLPEVASASGQASLRPPTSCARASRARSPSRELRTSMGDIRTRRRRAARCTRAWSTGRRCTTGVLQLGCHGAPIRLLDRRRGHHSRPAPSPPTRGAAAAAPRKACAPPRASSSKLTVHGRRRCGGDGAERDRLVISAPRSAA